MSNLFDNYDVKIIKEDKTISITCQVHNHSFRKVIKNDDECIKDNFDLFYKKLKDSSYKVEHYSLNNFKVIFENITLILEKDKSLTDRIEELEEENKSIKELLIEIKNNQKPIHKLYNKVGDKIYEGELSKDLPVYGKAYSNEELIYEGYFIHQKYYGEGKLYEKNKIKEEGIFMEGKLVKGKKYMYDDIEKGSNSKTQGWTRIRHVDILNILNKPRTVHQDFYQAKKWCNRHKYGGFIDCSKYNWYGIPTQVNGDLATKYVLNNLCKRNRPITEKPWGFEKDGSKEWDGDIILSPGADLHIIKNKQDEGYEIEWDEKDYGILEKMGITCNPKIKIINSFETDELMYEVD